MTGSYIREKVKNLLEDYFGSNWYFWDGLQVYKFNNRTEVWIDVFKNHRAFEFFLTSHGYKFTKSNGCRGGYLGGGKYREIVSFKIQTR